MPAMSQANGAVPFYFVGLISAEGFLHI